MADSLKRVTCMVMGYLDTTGIVADATRDVGLSGCEKMIASVDDGAEPLDMAMQ